MAQPEHVAKFVHRFGNCAALQYCIILRFSVEARVEPRDREDGDALGTRSFTKDEIEFRNIEINRRHA